METDFDFGDNETQLVSTANLADVPSESGQRDIPTLILMDGAGAGATFRIEKSDMMIGRAEDVQVRILDSNVSRYHARLLIEGDKIFIEDLGSTNGTLVNGTKIAARRLLEDGDKIAVSAVGVLKFAYQDPLEERFQQRIYDRASRDGLTGVFNRKTFDEKVAADCRHNRRVGLVMFDVDHFKKINDGYGHPAGDAVLVEIARRAGAVLRQDDMLARYGGEEFAVLCQGATPAQVAMIGERVRVAIAAAPIEIDGHQLNVTVSVGVSAAPAADVRSAEQLVGTADRALYCAKSRGRNQVASHRGEQFDLVDGRAPTNTGR